MAQASRAFRLGVFIVLTLLGFAAGIFWIGHLRLMFTPTYRLYADFTTVAGLNNGAEVRVAGIHEGTVARIELPAQAQGKVRVAMQMKRGTQNVLRKDSVAAIRSEGLVGDTYVEISQGSEQSPRVKPADVIGSEPPIELSDLVKKADGILNSAQGAMGDLSETTANLRSVTGKINSGQGTVGALINDRKMYEHANSAAESMQEDAEALKHNFLLRGFFKKQGYENPEDLKKNKVPQLPAGAPVKRFSYESGKLFDKGNGAKLKKAKDLNDAGNYLQSNGFGVAVVAAHADANGDSDKNQIVAEARAKVVRDYLVNNFKLEDGRIKTFAFTKEPESNSSGELDVLIYPASTAASASGP